MLDSNKDHQKLEAMKLTIGVGYPSIHVTQVNCYLPVWFIHVLYNYCTIVNTRTSCMFHSVLPSFQMIAKGKDCSDLFPAVVKNVVTKNSEVRVCACVCVCVSSTVM